MWICASGENSLYWCSMHTGFLSLHLPLQSLEKLWTETTRGLEAIKRQVLWSEAADRSHVQSRHLLCKYEDWGKVLWHMFFCDVEALCGALLGYQSQLFLFTGGKIILPKKHKFLRWDCCSGTLKSGHCSWTKTGLLSFLGIFWNWKMLKQSRVLLCGF